MATQSPPTRPLSSRRSTASSKGLSLDLSQSPRTIRDLIAQTAAITRGRRSSPSAASSCPSTTRTPAIAVRQIWNGEAILGNVCRVYFGTPTPIDQHLKDHPPHGWEMKLEDAPNRQVHAEDLADALAKLHHASRSAAPGVDTPVSPVDGTRRRGAAAPRALQPDAHEGASPDLRPSASRDMTDEPAPSRRPSPSWAYFAGRLSS
ncbi:hypothetical protein EV126DRAFT_489670 [Verticillium dahliae]|nr:hypothetical protein EV126DRAFT_489670 [Verticillium dahliae]